MKTVEAPEATETGWRAVGVRCRGLVTIYRLEGYEVVALAGVDLDIAAGESVALLGPSGSGKSTLLSVLAGLLRPSAGRAFVAGVDLAKATEGELARMRATEVGVVLQNARRGLLPYLTAEQNVAFAQRPAVGRDLLAPTAVLAQVGIEDRKRARLVPHELTAGERQRLAIAVALARRPGLLLVDEPTSQLDAAARDEVIAALADVNRGGTTVVVVTHDPAVGAPMDRTVTIRDGRVGAQGVRGEEYAVVGRDGSVQLPQHLLDRMPPGTHLRVVDQPDGGALLVIASDPTRAEAEETR
ncbi:MAG: ABC transporter ATP-binding protein [Hamadaea sp.]|nr:ABC transporter ATP-binding protein [Hamadaea sp.]